MGSAGEPRAFSRLSRCLYLPTKGQRGQLRVLKGAEKLLAEISLPSPGKGHPDPGDIASPSPGHGSGLGFVGFQQRWGLRKEGMGFGGHIQLLQQQFPMDPHPPGILPGLIQGNGAGGDPASLPAARGELVLPKSSGSP